MTKRESVAEPMKGTSLVTLICSLGSAGLSIIANVEAFSGMPTETQVYVGGAVEKLANTAAPLLAFTALLSILLIVDGIQSVNADRLFAPLILLAFSVCGSVAFFVHLDSIGRFMAPPAVFFSLVSLHGILRAGPSGEIV